MKKSFVVIAALAAAAGSALAQRGSVVINEALINPPGTDQGLEYVELKSMMPNMPLTGLWLVTIDGDNNAAGDSIATGVIDQAIDLSSYTTGANGLLLIRDTTLIMDTDPAAGVQGPDPLTNVVIRDFVPDIENGSNTFLIVRGFTGSVGQDLDFGPGGDGVLDATPWTEVIDAIGYRDGDDVVAGVNSYVYATQLGGLNVSFQINNAPNAFTPDGFSRFCDKVVALDVVGLSPGPYFFDANETMVFNAAGAIIGFSELLDPNWVLTPGVANIGDNDCGGGGPVCNDIDVNNDNSSFDPTDIDAFLSVFSEGPCIPETATCDSIDFNNDGSLFDPCDIDSFLLVFSEGPCTLCGV